MKLLLTLLLIGMIGLTACTSSFTDCMNVCKPYKQQNISICTSKVSIADNGMSAISIAWSEVKKCDAETTALCYQECK